MKQLRIFFIISCFVMAFCFSIFYFSGISIAEQISYEDCIKSCAGKQQTCFNINADKRQCEVAFKSCNAACKTEADSASATQPPAQPPTQPRPRPDTELK